MTELSHHVDADFHYDVWTLDAPPLPVHPLLEKLVNETQSAALLTAVIASAVNMLREPGVSKTQAELQMYMPNPAGMMFAVRVLARDVHLPAHAHASILAFFGGLEPCLRETERYFADASVLGLERACALHQFSLAGTWRHACHAAGDAVQDLNAETQDLLPELYALSAGILGRLLIAAAKGQSPCMSGEGKPFLPALPQRRLASRRLLQQTATLTVGGRTTRVRVRDVSQGGLGLEQTGRLRENAVVTVALATGRRFTGTIVWCKANRAGIRFTIPLTPNDPLLWG